MRLLAALLSIGIASCATFEAADNVRQGSPRFFAGTRLDLAAITRNEAALDHFKAYEMTPPAYPRTDLLPSLAADVMLFPVAVGYTVTEPLLYIP
jgi:hypothetical protein